ncbi:MAG: hypothetical protein AAFQ06_06840 [Pseudomonadota bacterium]
MGEFLTLLLSYYLCDATAATRPMGTAERAACIETYDEVKTYFVPGFELAPEGSLDRFAQMQAGYVAFKAWEEANAETVEELRATAWARVTGVTG